MKLFFVSGIIVTVLALLSGYWAMYVPKFKHLPKKELYSQKTAEVIHQIQIKISQKKLKKARNLVNDLIVKSRNKHAVSKAYFLRSKINFFEKNISGAKKDLSYAKEIEFDAFSKTAKYPFIKSLRSLEIYESQLNSGYKKSYIEDLIPTFYYVLSLILFAIFTAIAKLGFSKQDRTKELRWE